MKLLPINIRLLSLLQLLQLVSANRYPEASQNVRPDLPGSLPPLGGGELVTR